MNKTEKKHTALPLKVGLHGVVCKDDKYSTPMANCNLQSILMEEAEANASFIVKACNSHYELVEALRECKALIEKYDEYGWGDNIRIRTKKLLDLES